MPSLNLNYVHSSSLGYGRLGVKLAEALVNAGITVYDGMESPDLRDQAAQAKEPRKYGRSKNVCWVSTPTHARGCWSDQTPSVFSMFEAMYLPEAYRESLDFFETVLVPSHQNVEIFSLYHPNVHLVTLGIDPKDWHYVPRTPPDREFYFLIGGSGRRKGTDLAHQAFRKVFPDGSWGDGPIPHLIMKNPRNESFYGDRIQMIGGKISAQAEIELYEMAHCYLQPSRGEGFGLQPLQALAQGMPTILTAAHGHDSFAHLGHGLSYTPARAEGFMFGESGDWWEPSLDDLCAHMEYVYNNYDKAQEKAKYASQVISEDFTWEACAKQFIKALNWEEGDSTSAEWKKPQLRRYLVRVVRPWAADIAGESLHLYPGKDYWEAGDVKRQLMESGVLDPSCILSDQPGSEADLGLTVEQLASVKEYSGAHAYCHSCGQQLNTKPTRADEFMRVE